MRRILVILLLLAIGGAAVWTLRTWGVNSGTQADPWSAVPERAGVIMEVPNALSTWERFVHTSQLWSSVERLPGAAALARLMARATEQAENEPAFRATFEEVSVIVAMVRGGQDQVDLLFAFAPRSSGALPQQFAAVVGLEANDLSRAAQGDIVAVRPDTAWPALSLTATNGIWLIATSPALMEESLLRLEKQNTAPDDQLAAARNTLGSGSDAHVMVHGERGKALLHTWWTPATIDAIDMPRGWAALDLRSRPDAILLSGLFLPGSPATELISIGEQGSGRTDLARWMPTRIAHWDVRRITNASQYLARHAAEDVRAELGPALFAWVHGHIGLGSMIDSAGAETLRLAYFQTEDPEAAASALGTLCQDRSCDTLSYRGTRLVRMPVSGALERLLGSAYAPLPQPWWCVLGDVVVMAPGANDLSQVVDAWNDGRTLAEDARTAAWTERIASHAGRTIRWDIARFAAGIAHGLKPEARAHWNAWSSVCSRLGGASIQLSPAQHGYTHLAIGLHYAPLEEKRNGAHWSIPLGRAVSRKPDILRNHVNGTREVLVQDVDHTIHLIGPSGKRLWSHPLEGPILGGVHQIDRFKNGKLQMLFNTSQRIHLIDRNGKEVGGYPLDLKPGASAPLAVFDYDGQRDYRILVPMMDGNLRNYTAEAQAVEGWAPKPLAEPAINAVHHLRLGNKDHLVVVDGDGQVVLLDRRGAPREAVKAKLAKGARVLEVRPGQDVGGTRMTWSDEKGMAQVTTLDGRTAPLLPGAPWATRPMNIPDQAQEATLAWRGDSLTLVQGGRQVFARSFGDSLAGAPMVYDMGSMGPVLGVVLAGRGAVSLVDLNGRELEGTPVAGSTALSIADLDLDGTLEFITATADGHVVAYHLPIGTSSAR